ncbi:hypothetical protein SAMN05421858_4040 [Haladaptatus litoreus]|uniref:Uncharacterized protein n=1 Tax=Haladaptatus litoreus TaxID=553468 RepID=A0A1N7E5S8_9EURY|nr:DUF6789 family protein [Haladaptatus litoreus]SIR83355.1 hypothetical protein SAMN05421858_4040 [Haladaptatus litoreus]
MADNDTQPVVDVDVSEGAAEPDFDNLTGIVVDGVIGAVGGLVGTAVMTAVLLVAATLNAFDLNSFVVLAELTGTTALFPANPAAIGYLVFLGGGMVTWPLLFASIGSYLPGEKYATKGIPYGFVLWTGFALAFYDGYTGLLLVLYLVLTLLSHFAYGFALGAVFDYLSKRPTTLV